MLWSLKWIVIYFDYSLQAYDQSSIASLTASCPYALASFSCLPALTHGARTSALAVLPDWLSEAFREMRASSACVHPFSFLTKQGPQVSARMRMSRPSRSTQGGGRCARLRSVLPLAR